MKTITKQIMTAAEEGMAKAGIELINDAIMEEPTVPMDTGRLRSSGSAIVNGKLVYVSPQVGAEPGTPATEDSTTIQPGQIITIAGFNTKYAAKVHEVPMNFRTPGSGNKYLEAKLGQFGDKYYGIVANVISSKG
jgi:hypothetical protein